MLKVHCFFEELHYDIEELPDDTKQQLGAAGVEIQKFLSKHNDNKYLLIIEGQASKNSDAWTDRNYDLSFERAYSLMKYWKDVCGINFGKTVRFKLLVVEMEDIILKQCVIKCMKSTISVFDSHYS